MKASKIKWIILLSVISLISILVFQGIWLKQATDNNRRTFDYAVNEAIKGTVKKLEKHLVLTMVKQNKHTDSLLENIKIQIERKDSTVQVDSVTGEMQRQTSKYSEVLILKDDSNNKSSLKERVTEVIGGVISDLRFKSITKSRKPQYEILDSFIRESLKQQGITNSFDYAIKVMDTIITYKSPNYEKAASDSEYSTTLSSPVNKLYVKISNKEEFILNSLLPFLLAMLFFSIVIIITFAISIRTILKQKKISTIKNDFINNMTHEFKTPIATISLAADALKSQIANKEQTNHFADIIKQESQSMNQKVETILQMALVEQQEIKLDKEKVGVNKLVKSAIEHHKLKLESLGGELIADYLEADITINADTHHMGNVVSNIIDNAIKYAGGTPDIAIKLIQLKDSVVINIADKGIGMSRDEQKRVFDKFYRAEGGNIHNTKGFGLGLSYASEIMKLHNGQIHIESEKGKGTTVSLTLPIENED